jgi:hypothetical protein
MPLRVGDRGLFICGPDDIAPDDLDGMGRPPRRIRDPAVRHGGGPPALELAAAGPVWLVLALCPHCSPAHGGYYCREHNDRNWWITRSGVGRRR